MFGSTVRRRFLKAVISFLAGAAFLIGWAEFIFKPIAFYSRNQNFSLFDAFLDLMKIQPAAYDWPFSGYILIASSILLIYIGISLLMRPVRWILDSIDTSEAPISILESQIEIFLTDASLSSSKTTRTQLLHANHDDVDAYHYSQRANYGLIDTNSVTMDSRINGILITKELLKRVEQKSVDTIEIFRSSLPTNVVATYLSDTVVRWLYRQFKFFAKNLVVRTAISCESGEYCVQYPMYQLTAQRYPVSHIEIVINFPIGSIKKNGSIRAFLIMNQAVQEIPVQSVSDNHGREQHKIELNRLRQQQSIRVTWENVVQN